MLFIRQGHMRENRRTPVHERHALQSHSTPRLYPAPQRQSTAVYDTDGGNQPHHSPLPLGSPPLDAQGKGIPTALLRGLTRPICSRTAIKHPQPRRVPRAMETLPSSRLPSDLVFLSRNPRERQRKHTSCYATARILPLRNLHPPSEQSTGI